MAKKHKGRQGVVYSTNPDYEYNDDGNEKMETRDRDDQKLKVKLDTKHRKGKVVTLVEGFVGSEDDLKDLGKLLKTKCGTGGSVKDGEIIIQGDVKSKVVAYLQEMGYGVKG